MKLQRFPKGFTLIELLVVISIIAILATMSIPAAIKVIAKAKQATDLANARQVYIALSSFAADHEQTFPTSKDQDSSDTPTPISNANEAYANLVPKYLGTEKTFWVSGSGWCKPVAPDENTSAGNCLVAGENNYAYVSGLNQTSTGSFPLIADGFVDGSIGTYSINGNAAGGVWKAEVAIVIRVDGSAAREVVRSIDQKVYGRTGGATSADIFAPSANWLDATKNVIYNPAK